MDQHFAFLWIIEVNGRNLYISVDRMLFSIGYLGTVQRYIALSYQKKKKIYSLKFVLILVIYSFVFYFSKINKF